MSRIIENLTTIGEVKTWKRPTAGVTDMSLHRTTAGGSRDRDVGHVSMGLPDIQVVATNLAYLLTVYGTEDGKHAPRLPVIAGTGRESALRALGLHNISLCKETRGLRLQVMFSSSGNAFRVWIAAFNFVALEG